MQGRGGSLQIGGSEGDEETGGSDPAMGRRIFSQVFSVTVGYNSLQWVTVVRSIFSQVFSIKDKIKECDMRLF